MNLEKTTLELRTEPVPPDAVDQAIAALRPVYARRSNRAVWLAPTALTCFAIGVALWPFSKGDQVWANAYKTLHEAKYAHIRFVKRLETVEAWRSGKKLRRMNGLGEERFNGSALTERLGFLSSVKAVKSAGVFPLLDMGEFEAAESKIAGKEVKPKSVRIDGRPLNAYAFTVGEVFDGPSDFRTAGNRNARYPDNHHVGFLQVTAYVDPAVSRIVRLDQMTLFDPKVPTAMRDIFNMQGFQAAVDYPGSLPDSMFDPPADAFDYAKTKTQVAQLLKGQLGEAVVAGQKVILKGLLYDGINAYAIWDGCAGDYQDGNWFKIDGVQLKGQSADTLSPTRCFSSAKCLRPATAKSPYCAIGEAVSKPLPSHVRLTLPVFSPNPGNPYLDSYRQVVGFHSRKVGEAVFDNVPVIPIKSLSFYEREFGLLNSCW